MRKRLGLLGLGILVLCGVCGLVSAVGGIKLIGSLLDSSRVVGDRASAFMEALRDKKLNDAYAMLTPDLQDQKSKPNFREAFANNSLKDWTFNNFSVRDDLGYVAGTATDEEGIHFVAFQLVNSQGVWAISGYNLGTLGWVGTVVEPVN